MSSQRTRYSIAIIALVFTIAFAGLLPTYAAAFGPNGDFEKGGHFHADANLTDEQKAILEEVKKLHEEGNYEEAHALLVEAGLHSRRFMKRGMRRFARHNPEVRAAIEAGDYQAFEEAIEGTKLEEYMSEERFLIMVEALELHKDGDHEAAHTLMQSLKEDILSEKNQK